MKIENKGVGYFERLCDLKAENLKIDVDNYKFASFKGKRTNLWAHNFETATAT